jgi:hypothetical protein
MDSLLHIESHFIIISKNVFQTMIFLQINQQLDTLYNLINGLSDEQYCYSSTHLAQSSIGQHTRHIIELIQCAVDGISSGVVDYVNRSRNLDLECDRHFAMNTIRTLQSNLEGEDKILSMVIDKSECAQSQIVSTTYYREIVYNTEHTIHHLALIKVALIEMDLDLVDANFGMAYATIQYKTQLQADNSRLAVS